MSTSTTQVEKSTLELRRSDLSAIRSVCLLLVLLIALLPSRVEAEEKASPEEVKASFNEQIEGLSAHEGLLATYLDSDKGRVLLALPAPDEEGRCARVIYAEYLAAGLGSNPVNLDRGQPGRSLLVAFRRVGGKVLIEAENWSFVASGENPQERLAVERSFASSILWGTEILATSDEGRLLIDLTGFLLLDAHASAAKLERNGQGSFRFEASRSAVDPDAAFVFEDNLEFDARLSFVSEKPGAEVRGIAPDPRSVQLIQHHSFVRLPEPGYLPRIADPRAGQNTLAVQDYGSDLTQPIVRHLALRHRLQKTNPGEASSPVMEPIVYYVDRGAPALVRQALIEGGTWWNEAFEAAGFQDAFRLETLPEGVHPLDARYHVIHWVHRATRGWSYGGSIYDPRSGEIVRGNVLLGSLRVRQDRMIFEGLVGVEASGGGGPNDPVELALARIRQLSAHEIGHTLGLAHNMAASTQNRASVMDYPAPEVRIREDGSLDLSQAYGIGIGAWDRFAIEMLYREFPPGEDPATELEALARRSYEGGILYVADEHSRNWGTGHPEGALWDTGDDSVVSLRQNLRVRRWALDHFGEQSLPAGRPWSELRERIVPIYLFHRYQVEAACKKIGGIRFGYAVNGDGQEGSQAVPAEEQWEALEAVLECLSPELLNLDDDLLSLLSPHEPGFLEAGVARELFAPTQAQAFELDRAADTAVAITLMHLLHRDRLARVEELHLRDPELPSLNELLERIVDELVPRRSKSEGRTLALERVVQQRLMQQLIQLSADASANWRVRAAVDTALDRFEGRLSKDDDTVRWMRTQITRYRDEGELAETLSPAAIPPGSPIGGCGDWLAIRPAFGGR